MKARGMIDIGNKNITRRTAGAQAIVRLNKEIVEKIRAGDMPKGNVLEYARIAGILACKKTDELIPLCHTIGVEHADIRFTLSDGSVIIESTVKSTGKTGVEMEAMISAAVAALTIYDMSKMFSRGIEIEKVCLLEKRGGKSGRYVRR